MLTCTRKSFCAPQTKPKFLDLRNRSWNLIGVLCAFEGNQLEIDMMFDFVYHHHLWSQTEQEKLTTWLEQVCVWVCIIYPSVCVIAVRFYRFFPFIQFVCTWLLCPLKRLKKPFNCIGTLFQLIAVKWVFYENNHIYYWLNPPHPIQYISKLILHFYLFD